MDSKLNNFNLSQFSDISDCNSKITIKTSKQWVLPPRPRPGRKPTSSATSPCPSSTSTTTSTATSTTTSTTTSTPTTSNSTSPQATQPLLKKEPKKTYRRKTPSEKAAAKQAKALAAAAKLQAQTFNINPIELALTTIKDENKSLKLELSKLVKDLKILQQQKQQESCVHKKRNHLEMEREDSLVSDDDLHHLYFHQDSEDDVSSTISTPSLVSSHSSALSHSNSLNMPISSSLSSIKEEQILKIDDFLTTSYFDQSNSISKSNPILKEKPTIKNANVMLSPPSIPTETADSKDFQFTFLKQEQVSNDHYDSLFNSITINENEDVFMSGDWEWK